MSGGKQVLVLGGHVDGLVAATYLARKGRSVLLVEGSDALGGPAQSTDIAPGFRAGVVSESLESFSPEIIQELGLEAHGLRLLPPGGVLLPSLDGESLYLRPPAAGASINLELWDALGTPDSHELGELDGFMRRLAKTLTPVLGRPLPRLQPQGPAGLFSLLGDALRLRRLGRKDLAEALRLLPMPVADVVEERFQSEALRALVAAGALPGALLGPRSPGTAALLLLRRCGLERGAVGYPRPMAGGTGSLVTALEKAARAAGVDIRLDTPVEQILVERGQVVGVLLGDGQELRAESVLSSLDPKTTLLRLVEGGTLDPDFAHQVQRLRNQGPVAIARFALNALPSFLGAEDGATGKNEQLAGRIQIGASIDALEQAYDNAKYGQISERPWLDVSIPSLADPSLAPEGQHVLTARVQFAPRQLRAGDWQQEGDTLQDRVQSQLEAHAPGFARLVQARDLLTPADIEQRYGLSGGCLDHLLPAMDQLLHLRPVPGWAHHNTPLPGLYLGGPGCHGGLGLSGLPGRNAARAILAG